MYYFACDCGTLLAVELFQAGTTVECPKCNLSVTVPNSTELQQLSGDKYPHLQPLDKVIAALAEQAPPFDGTCHRCGNQAARFQVPIRFDLMVERHVSEEGGIRPTLTGVKLVSGAAEEQWRTVTFPLLLCERCHASFSKAQTGASVIRWARNVSFVGLLLLFLYFGYHYLEVVAALAGILGIVGGIAWALRFRDTRKGDHWVVPWLQRIQWVPEAIAAEDEYRLAVASSLPFTPPKAT